MATLLCSQYPELSIFNPSSGEYTKFDRGRLDIEEGDPNYEVVMAEAARNPAIAVYINASTCVHCGETVSSKAKLAGHVKAIHFDKWIEGEDSKHATERIAQVKARAGVVCDACTPPGEFADNDALALHVSVVHTDKPDLADDGSDRQGGRGRKRPGEVEPIPAAAGSQTS